MNNYQVKLITNTQEWEQFVRMQPFTLMTQSYKYGEFYAKLNESYTIFGLYRKESLVGGALVISVHARRGNFLYMPYGPIIPDLNHEKLKTFLDGVKEFAIKKRYDFVRLSPFWDNNSTNQDILRSCGCRPAPMHALAEYTWLLDVAHEDDELLGKMNKNHRNLIRRCIKEGVRLEIKNDEKSLALFNSLHDTTAARHKFHRFSSTYITQEFNIFKEAGESAVFLAYLPDGRLDAAAVVFFYGTMAAYRHGASLNLNNKIPTSYLIQWHVIQKARKRGMKWYNFWGIAPDNAPASHPFKGITHFKKGFGGIHKDLIHCQDIPLSQTYWITWIIETARKIKRGF